MRPAIPHPAPRGAALAALLALAACAGGGYQPEVTPAEAAAAAADPVYACQMRGAMAEDRVYGPLSSLSIDTALVRNQVVQDCLAARGRPAASILPSPSARLLPGL